MSNITHYGQVGVVCGLAQSQFLLLLCSHALQHAVENVVVPLIVGLQGEREREYKYKCCIITLNKTYIHVLQQQGEKELSERL